MQGIKIDQLRPIVEKLKNKETSFGGACKQINKCMESSLIKYHNEITIENTKLIRASTNLLSFFERYRLSHLHEMNDKEIKDSHKYLQEMQEALS